MKKSTIIGGKDRDYYRHMRNTELLEEVKYAINVEWRELAIVLADRLRHAEQVEEYSTCPECDRELTI